MSYPGDSGYYTGSIVESIIASEAKVKFEDANVCLPLVTQVPMGKGDSWKIPVWNTSTVADTFLNAVDMAAITVHSTGTVAAQVASSKGGADCAKYGMYIPIYDEAEDSSAEDVNDRLGGLAANIAGAKVDALIAALFDSFTNTAGASTAALTVDNLFSALGTLDSNGAMGQLECVVHPLQLFGSYGVMNDLIINADYAGGAAQNQGITNGLVNKIAGINVYSSRNCATATSSHFGAVFTRDAMGFGWVNPLIRIEVEREGKLLRNDIVASLFGSAAQLVDVWGVELKTKTS